MKVTLILTLNVFLLGCDALMIRAYSLKKSAAQQEATPEIIERKPAQANNIESTDCIFDGEKYRDGGVINKTSYEKNIVPYNETCVPFVSEFVCRKGVMYITIDNRKKYSFCKVDAPKSCGSISHASYETRKRYYTPTVPFGRICAWESQIRHCTDGAFSEWNGSHAFPACSVSVPTNASISINSGITNTTSSLVNLTLVADGASEMKISNSPDCSGVYMPFVTDKVWTLSQTNAQVSVYVKYKDVFGNESSCISDSIIHDTVSPDTTFASIKINNDAPSTLSHFVTLNIVPPSDAVEMVISNANCNIGTWETVKTSSIWQLNNIKGMTKAYVKFRDAAGNESNCIEDSIEMRGLSLIQHNMNTTAIASNSSQAITTANNNLYIGSRTSNDLSISSDGGNTFTTRSDRHGIPSSFNDIKVDGSTFVGVTDYAILLSSDGEQTFKAIMYDKICTNYYDPSSCVAKQNWSSSFALGYMAIQNSTWYFSSTGGILISSDGGSTFKQIKTDRIIDNNSTTLVSTGLISNNVDRIYIKDNILYALSYGVGVSVSTDGGSSFTSLTGLPSNKVTDLKIVDNIWYLTINDSTVGGLYMSPDGVNWVLKSNLSKTVYTVNVDSTNIYVGTANGLIVSNDAGSSFTINLALGGISVIHLDGHIIYTGSSSSVNKSIDYGNTFTQITRPSTLPISSIVADAIAYDSVSNKLYAASTQSGLLISADKGSTFSYYASLSNGLLTTNAVQDVIIHPTTRRVYVATNNGVSIIETNGSISHKTTADGLCSASSALRIDTKNNVVVVRYGNAIAISTDSGVTFNCTTTTTGLPANPATSSPSVYIDLDSNRIYIPSSAGFIVTPDFGASYFLNSTLNGSTATYIFSIYKEGSDLLVFTSSSLYYSNDGGDTFYKSQLLPAAVTEVIKHGDTYYLKSIMGLQITKDFISFSLKGTSQGLTPSSNLISMAIVGSEIYVTNNIGIHKVTID